MKQYDVYFRPISSPVIVVEAKNKEEAKQIALETIEDMTRDEIIDRIVSSMEDTEYEIVATNKIV